MAFSNAYRKCKDDIWKPTEEEVRRNRFSSNKFEYLPQTNTLVGDWCPFGLTELNLSEIWKFLEFRASGNRACPPWKAFAVFRETPCKSGVTLDVDFYGSTGGQCIQFLPEILQRVSKGQSFTDPDICVHIQVFFPTDIDDAELSNFAVSRGLSIGPLGQLREMIVVEQQSEKWPLSYN